MAPKIIIHDGDTGKWLSFIKPIQLYSIYSHDEIIPALADIEKKVNTQNSYAAGFISYEAAPAFDEALTVKDAAGFPLMWFGLFEECEDYIFPEIDNDIFNHPELLQSPWNWDTGEDDYSKKIVTIKDYIKKGDTYQVNYTIRLGKDFPIDPFNYFNFMRTQAEVRYGAYLDIDGFIIISLSPELFFKKTGDDFLFRPMKGTEKRGENVIEDLVLREKLYTSVKNRAENLMIVDMIRNDIGHIAEKGSINVPRLYEIEEYPRIFQMVSDVTAKSGASLDTVFKSIFPSASITGAPKVETMKIISELEDGPRKIYTGSIGFIAPGKTQFNVAIRTLLVDKKNRHAEYGVGGGIVWDSEAEKEYRECAYKSAVIENIIPPFDLLETMLWEPETGYFLKEHHIDRLEQGARFFGFPFNEEKVRLELEGFEHHLSSDNSYRIRLLLNKTGEIALEFYQYTPFDKVYTVKLADYPVKSDNFLLKYKTTKRDIYNKLKKNETDDTILWNERGEITESLIANIVIEQDGELFTPALSSGLLPGTFRSFLIDTNKIKEKTIGKNELLTADKIFLINSLRKWMPAQLVIP